MKLLDFPIIKLTFFLSLGICIALLIEIPLRFSIFLSCFFFILLGITLFIAKNRLESSIWFGLTAYLTVLSLGVLVTYLHNEKNFENHYSKQISINHEVTHSLTFRINKKLKSGLYYDKYIIDLSKLDNQLAIGKLLLNIQKDSTLPAFRIDDILMTASQLKPLTAALNPNQFDYKNYLEKQYIYHQIFTEKSRLYQVSSQKHTIYGYADALREQINQKLNTYNFKPNELAIINALLLGQRQDIDKDIYNSYTNAGAVHILAVSGLHVGIILLLLNFVFRPIEYLKHGKAIKVFIILILLWSFAVVAGLSASVTRAVTMFSAVAIAMHWNRPTNIYNTLAISIFILLLFKPMFLVDVGFQMSYLAVIAIVAIRPILYKIWKPKLKQLDYFWQIFTVTMAAQFGVIPISLYYFHQFPGLFFISNLAIIPCLGLILGLGILVIILALFDILPDILANAFGGLINWMNLIVAWVSKQEQFLFKDVSFSILYLIASYVFIISLVRFYKKRSSTNLSFILVSVLITQAVILSNTYKNQATKFIIFHKSRYSLIGYKTNTKLDLTHNFDSLTRRKDKVITNFTVGNFITKVREDTLQSIYGIGTKKLLVVDNLGIYNVKTFKPDYVLLRNSPRINLQRLIDSIQPKAIIADGSNYKSYVRRWETTCAKQKLPFHQTGKKGAYIIHGSGF